MPLGPAYAGPGQLGSAAGSPPSGDADVVVLLGGLEFGLGDVLGPDRDDQAPVVADRAALHPRHHQVQFLQLDSGDPDGGEEPRSAANSATVGMTISKVAPRPLGLWTRTEPWWASAMACTMGRPRPNPPTSRLR